MLVNEIAETARFLHMMDDRDRVSNRCHDVGEMLAETALLASSSENHLGKIKQAFWV